jgi:hypothetical protein
MQKDPRAQFIKEMDANELNDEWEKIKQTRPELKYDTAEECAEDYFGYIKEGEDWGRWTNPSSKWDWYTIGGRWTGYFKPKADLKYPDDIILGSPGAFGNKPTEGYVDSIRLCDIDFEGMENDSRINAEKNWEDAQELIEKGDKSVYFMYGIKANQTKEDYINEHSKFSAFALLKDGVWYAKGEMGWWAAVSDEKDNWQEEFTKLIASLPEDTLLTVVDCHI